MPTSYTGTHQSLHQTMEHVFIMSIIPFEPTVYHVYVARRHTGYTVQPSTLRYQVYWYTTSATGDLQLPDHICGTRCHDCAIALDSSIGRYKDISVWVVRQRRLVPQVTDSQYNKDL